MRLKNTLFKGISEPGASKEGGQLKSKHPPAKGRGGERRLSGGNGRGGAKLFFVSGPKFPPGFKIVRDVTGAILAVRPKCSHRCVSSEEIPYEKCVNRRARDQKIISTALLLNEVSEKSREI